eukprot:g22134.t1
MFGLSLFVAFTKGKTVAGVTSETARDGHHLKVTCTGPAASSSVECVDAERHKEVKFDGRSDSAPAQLSSSPLLHGLRTAACPLR